MELLSHSFEDMALFEILMNAQKVNVVIVYDARSWGKVQHISRCVTILESLEKKIQYSLFIATHYIMDGD